MRKPNIRRAVIGLLVQEGNYTTWTIQAIYETGCGYYDYGDDVGIRNDGQVIFHDHPYTNRIISPDGILLSTLTEQQLRTIGSTHSIFYRYILGINTNLSDIIIQEGIGETWRRTVDDDKGDYILDVSPLRGAPPMAISPSGEWIAVIVLEATTGNGLIFIYKGS